MKKVPKKKKSEAMEIIFDDIPSPSIYNTLPFQVPLFIWHTPSYVKNIYKQYLILQKEKVLKKKEEEEETKDLNMQKALLIEEKLKLKEFKKRKIVEKPPEKNDVDLEGFAQLKAKELNRSDFLKPADEKVQISGGIWTDEDITLLIALVKKYTVGVQRRWEIIADIMGRSVSEVTFMAAKLKENSYKNDQPYNEVENYSLNLIGQQKLENVDILVPEKNWSQIQQKALEDAIVFYREYAQSEKWSKIAEYVPAKTKEECQSRYKYLVQLVKNSKPKKHHNSNLKQNNEIFAPNQNSSQYHNCSDDKEEVQKVLNSGKKRNLRKQRKQQAAELGEDSDYSN